MDDTNELADRGDSVNYVRRMHAESTLLMNWATDESNNILSGAYYGDHYTPGLKVRMIAAKPVGYWAAVGVFKLLATLETIPGKPLPCQICLNGIAMPAARSCCSALLQYCATSVLC